MNLLLIEDNYEIAKIIFEYFEIKGHSLDYAFDGKLGLKLGLEQNYDLIILDLMLPKLDGLQVCQQLREHSCNTPILMLTARDKKEDELAGFSLGADDYLVKPFDLDVLFARVMALTKRYDPEHNNKKELFFHELKLDVNQRILYRGTETFQLNPTLFEIIKLLILNAPDLVSRKTLIEHLWQTEEPETDILRSHIYQLRNRIDKPFKHAYIRTLPKVGYQLVAP